MSVIYDSSLCAIKPYQRREVGGVRGSYLKTKDKGKLWLGDPM